jgi:hypothetical protein
MRHFGLISLVVLLFAQPSMAIFEVHLGYGVLDSKPDLAALYTGASTDIPSAAPNAGVTLDAIVTLPLVGLGLGARLENMNISYDSSALKIANQLNRTALIVNYRLPIPILNIGPVFTYGLNHSNKIKINEGSTANISSSKVSSYSLGAELSASLVGFMVGAEVGKMWMNYKDATDSVTSRVDDLDMSGNYAKLFIGFGI